MKNKLIIAVGCFFLLGASLDWAFAQEPARTAALDVTANAEEIQQAFDSGLGLYDAGKYADAATAFERIARSGHRNGHVFYNLALAYYRQGDFGRAMAAVLAARDLLPRDPDVKSNLKFLEGRLQDKLSVTAPVSTSERLMGFWIDGLSVRELLLATFVTALLATGVILAFFFVPKLRPYRVRGLVAVALPVIAATLLATKWSMRETWGAIIPEGAKVYSGPSETNTLLFSLNPGAPVRVADGNNGGYRMITLSDGKKGWVAQKDLAVF